MSIDDLNPERRRRRIARLRTELIDEEVDLHLDEAHPAWPILLDEILYARQSPVHEGKRNSYGVIVIDTHEQLAELTGLPKKPGNGMIDLLGDDPSKRDVSYARKACNGRTTFLVRSPDGPQCLLELNNQAGEEQLAQLTSPHIRVIQRTPGGVVKVFTRSRVYVFEHDEWRAKAYSSDAVGDLERIFFPQAPVPTVEILKDLLSLCLHVLSSRHIGAAFIWKPDVAHQNAGTAECAPGEPAPARLFVNQRHHREAIASFVSTVDGACRVGPTGEVERTKLQLGASPRARELVAAEPGLRHTSAKRYSFDDPGCMVFVVSHDGPVTVYADGMSVLEIRTGPSYAPVAGGVPEFDWFDGHRTITCPGCAKELVVERFYARRRVERLTIPCPICQRPGLDSDNAIEMRAWPQKPWTGWAVGARMP